MNPRFSFLKADRMYSRPGKPYAMNAASNGRILRILLDKGVPGFHCCQGANSLTFPRPYFFRNLTFPLAVSVSRVCIAKSLSMHICLQCLQCCLPLKLQTILQLLTWNVPFLVADNLYSTIQINVAEMHTWIFMMSSDSFSCRVSKGVWPSELFLCWTSSWFKVAFASLTLTKSAKSECIGSSAAMNKCHSRFKCCCVSAGQASIVADRQNLKQRTLQLTHLPSTASMGVCTDWTHCIHIDSDVCGCFSTQ